MCEKVRLCDPSPKRTTASPLVARPSNTPSVPYEWPSSEWPPYGTPIRKIVYGIPKQFWYAQRRLSHASFVTAYTVLGSVAAVSSRRAPFTPRYTRREDGNTMRAADPHVLA